MPKLTFSSRILHISFSRCYGKTPKYLSGNQSIQHGSKERQWMPLCSEQNKNKNPPLSNRIIINQITNIYNSTDWEYLKGSCSHFWLRYLLYSIIFYLVLFIKMFMLYFRTKIDIKTPIFPMYRYSRYHSALLSIILTLL